MTEPVDRMTERSYKSNDYQWKKVLSITALWVCVWVCVCVWGCVCVCACVCVCVCVCVYTHRMRRASQIVQGYQQNVPSEVNYVYSLYSQVASIVTETNPE